MKSKLTAQNIVLTLLTIVELYWVITSFGLELWVRGGPGPGFFPLLAGIMCVGFSLYTMIREWNKESTTRFTSRALVPFGSVVAILIGIQIIGLFLSVVLFTFLWIFVFEKQKLKTAICTAIIWPGILYLIFGVWLGAPLPQGLLGLI